MRKQTLMSLLLVAGAFAFSGFQVQAINLPVSPVEMQEGLRYDVERKLLEGFAAPHWLLTSEQAWLEYKAGLIRIREVVRDKQYVLVRGGHDLLEVVLVME